MNKAQEELFCDNCDEYIIQRFVKETTEGKLYVCSYCGYENHFDDDN